VSTAPADMIAARHPSAWGAPPRLRPGRLPGRSLNKPRRAASLPEPQGPTPVPPDPSSGGGAGGLATICSALVLRDEVGDGRWSVPSPPAPNRMADRCAGVIGTRQVVAVEAPANRPETQSLRIRLAGREPAVGGSLPQPENPVQPRPVQARPVQTVTLAGS
jgi:hypothetical protein